MFSFGKVYFYINKLDFFSQINIIKYYGFLEQYIKINKNIYMHTHIFINFFLFNVVWNHFIF